MISVHVAIAILTTAGLAHGQPSPASAVAEQLFDEGRALAEAQRWAEACPKFEASLREDPAPGTRLNLAVCYEHIGKLASAWTLFRTAIEVARQSNDIKRREYAEQHAAVLEPRLPSLAISAVKPPVGLVVTRNGATVAAGALGVALYVDPGSHEIIGSAPGYESFTRTVVLVEGAAEVVVIPELGRGPDAAMAPREDGARPSEASAVRKYLAIGGGAAGVAAVGVGLLFGARSRSAFNDAKVLCGDDLRCEHYDDYPRGAQLVDDARSKATTSTVLVIAGGAAIAASVAVWLIAPSARERGVARIVPTAHHRGAGVAVLGRF